MVLNLPALPQELYEQGRSAALVSVQRNLKQALDPQAKTGNYMNSVLALQEARAANADEAIMLDHQGRVAEASSANVFAYIDGLWATPPLEVGILPGITRGSILDLCASSGQGAQQRLLMPDDLRNATEIFLCSSIREIVPVVRLDGADIGDGRVGSATKALLQVYRSEVDRQIQAEKRKA